MSAEDYIFEDPCESRERCMMDDSYNGKPAPFNPKFYSKKKKTKLIRNYITQKYIRIVRQTAGAILFQFDGMQSWIPRSICIITMENNTVRYQSWFEPHDATLWRNIHVG